MEVRICTYKRPSSLERALKCLQSQTWSNWKAIVFDDSPNAEAKQVVDGFADSRLIYQQNPKRLGAAGNLDQCFHVPAILGGQYAFVLEDDNGLRPEFIEANTDLIRTSGLGLILREQEVVEEMGERNWQFTGLKTKSRLYRTSGVYPALYVRGSLFFNDCIANGGLFWDTRKCRSKLVVGDSVSDSGLQEYCRTAQIGEPLLYCEEPLGLWTQMPKDQAVRSYVSNRVFGRAIQSLQHFLLRLHGHELVSSLWDTAKDLGEESALRKNLAGLADTRHSILIQHNVDTLLLLLKGLAKRAFVEDGLSKYLRSKAITEILESPVLKV